MKQNTKTEKRSKESKLNKSFKTLQHKPIKKDNLNSLSFQIQHKEVDKTLKHLSQKTYQKAVSRTFLATAPTQWTLKSHLTELYAQKALEEQSSIPTDPIPPMAPKVANSAGRASNEG